MSRAPMRGRTAPTRPVPTASTGSGSVAVSWRTCASRPAGGSELGQPLRHPTQCLSRLVWRQEDEIVEVLPEPLALLERRGQVGKVRWLLQVCDRELIDLLQTSVMDVVAAIAKLLEIGLGARQSARRQTLFRFDQHAWLAASDRRRGAVQHGLLMALDVDFDETHIAAIDVVEAVHRHL